MKVGESGWNWMKVDESELKWMKVGEIGWNYIIFQFPIGSEFAESYPHRFIHISQCGSSCDCKLLPDSILHYSSVSFTTISAHIGSSPIFQTIWDHLQSSGTILDYLVTIFYHLRPFETIFSYLGPSYFSAHLGPSHSNWDHLTPSGTTSDHSAYLLKAVLFAT